MRMSVLFLILVGIVGIAAVVTFRADMSRLIWERTHAFPETLLVISQDAPFGMEMGSAYLDGDVPGVTYDIDQAERLFLHAVAIDESVADGYYQLARISFLRSQYERALERIDRHVTLHEDVKPHVYYLKGLVQAFAGRPKEALETFMYYYTFDQTSWYVHNNIAWVQFQLGNFAEVDRFSAKGLEHNPNNPWLLMNRAVAQFNLGDTDEAIELLREAEKAAESQTEDAWLEHYPGNDPRIASLGLAEFQSTLTFNRELFHTSQ